MASSMMIPKFENETEEADWWYDNRHLVEQDFLQAAKEGRLKRGTLLQRVREAEAKKHGQPLTTTEHVETTSNLK